MVYFDSSVRLRRGSEYQPGYDPVSRYYLAFPSNLVVLPIPDAPTRDEALAALARLDALLDGYAFVEDEDVSRSVAIAMLMTQVLRCAMPVSPLMAVSAIAPDAVANIAKRAVDGKAVP